MKNRFSVLSSVSTHIGIISIIINKLAKKIVHLGSTNKLHLKCDVIDGSVVDGVRQPILYSFVLDKKPGFIVFCKPETIQYKKINKPVLNTITFYLEDDNYEKVDFNGENLTFTLKMIKL